MIRKKIPIPHVDKKDLPPLTVTMAANFIGVSSQAIYKAVKEDRLDAIEGWDGKVFILKSDLKKFAKQTGRKYIER